MKKKRDILFLCQFFYPEYVSSATLPYDTALALTKAGYKVGALCGYPREYAKEKNFPLKETVNEISITRTKYLQLGRKNFLSRLINYFSFTFKIFLHLFEIAKYKAVVVYSNPPILPWVAALAKKLFGTKLIFVAYDLYPEIAVLTDTLREGNLICRVMNHINKVVYKKADAVIALSSEMKEYIKKNRPIPEEKIHVIPNWYEDKKTENESGENSFTALTDSRFTIAYFGNMGIAQDMDTILSAAEKLKDQKDLCFLFAGHGKKFSLVKETLEKKGVKNAYLFEFLQGQRFQDALKIADCALVSLAENLTGLCVPSKTYSYMMRGTPLIAIMDEGDIIEDIRSGAGAWVKNGESEKLAQIILEMKEDKEKVAQMKNRCRAIFEEKYTLETCTKKYVSLFHQLLKQKNK